TRTSSGHSCGSVSSRDAACGRTPTGSTTRCRPTGDPLCCEVTGRLPSNECMTAGNPMVSGPLRRGSSSTIAGTDHWEDCVSEHTAAEQPYAYRRVELVEPDWTR